MNWMCKTSMVLLLFLALVSAASAQVKKVSVKVDGLVCPFCAYGLQKELKRVPGVADAKVYVDGGRVDLTVKNGQSFDFDAIEDAVKKGGYTPRDIWLEATGRVEQWNGRPALVISDNGEKLLLAGDEKLQKLSSSLGDQTGRSVTIAGKLQKQQPGGHHGHPHTLVIERFEVR